MNPSNLPPQGRYSDPRVQQMVLDELRAKNISPEKLYFTSDDWMVSYDGQVPAWNSVFGVAPYRKDGQTYYAEWGVSQRYDPNTAQWGEPAATVKEGLQISEADFEAAPGAIGSSATPAQAGEFGGQAPDQASGASGDRDPQALDGAVPDSSRTVFASTLPDVGSQESAADHPSDGLGGFAAGAADSRRSEDGGMEQADPWAVDAADARPADGADDDQRAAELATHPAGDGSTPNVVSAGNAGGAVAGVADAAFEQRDGEAGADLSGSADLDRPYDEADASSQSSPRHAQVGDDEGVSAGADAEVPSYEADAAAEAASHQPEGGVGGGSAIYGGDAINSREPAYDEPTTGNQANVAGYELTVNEDGTTELHVPLGGQVTLLWAGN